MNNIPGVGELTGAHGPVAHLDRLHDLGARRPEGRSTSRRGSASATTRSTPAAHDDLVLDLVHVDHHQHHDDDHDDDHDDPAVDHLDDRTARSDVHDQDETAGPDVRRRSPCSATAREHDSRHPTTGP